MYGPWMSYFVPESAQSSEVAAGRGNLSIWHIGTFRYKMLASVIILGTLALFLCLLIFICYLNILSTRHMRHTSTGRAMLNKQVCLLLFHYYCSEHLFPCMFYTVELLTLMLTVQWAMSYQSGIHMHIAQREARKINLKNRANRISCVHCI